jgi:hypothetical protein
MSDHLVAAYENPLVTASSRDQIADLYALCRTCSAVDVPRPLAFISALLRRTPGFDEKDILLRGVRAWSEVGDVCESESFGKVVACLMPYYGWLTEPLADGQRRCIVEHTIHVLFLPGLHTSTGPLANSGPGSSVSSSSQDLSSRDRPDHPDEPTICVPGTKLALPSPLHIRLPVTTRLSFNDAGRVTHHRDIWDVRDMLALLPGMSAAQWLGRRVAAQALSTACRAGSWLFGGSHEPASQDLEHGRRASRRLPSAQVYPRSERH